MKASDIIITTRPSALDVARAKREAKLVMTWLHLPQELLDLLGGDTNSMCLVKAWVLGWLHACGIEPEDYCYVAVHRVPGNLSIEEVRQGYLEAWEAEPSSEQLLGLTCKGLMEKEP